MLIDSHCHLTDERYGTPDGIISAFDSDRIAEVVTVGYDLSSSARALAIAEENPRVYAAVGVHPDAASEITSDALRALETACRASKTVALGEIGLDYHYEGYKKESQAEAFVLQTELAKKVDLPIIIHLREASGDLQKLFETRVPHLPRAGVLHCFSASYEVAKYYLDKGFYVSFSGSVTFKNAEKLRDVARRIPLDRLMIETDSPYLAPQAVRGQTNYPKNVRYVAETLAEIRNVSAEEIEEITAQNTKRLFYKMEESIA